MIYVADSAKNQITQMMAAEHLDPSHFVRVSVTSGGCSGLSYNMEFDNESKPNDHV